MKSYLLLAFVAAWIVSLDRVHAAGPVNSSVQSAVPSTVPAKCTDDLYWQAAREKMPAAIQGRQSDLMQLLQPAEVVRAGETIERCQLVAKAWGLLSNSYLVLHQTIVDSKTGDGRDLQSRSLAMALVRISADGTSLSVIAKTPAPLERKGWLYLKRFDFAPYQLNENETAFGLRTFYDTTYMGGGGSDDLLELFRVKDGRIEPILSTLMASSNFVHGEQRGDPKGAVIRVLPTKTDGVFDLKKSVRGSGAAIYRWNGHAYATRDPEPVECVNEPCEQIKWELTTQGYVNTSSDNCPASLGASVFDKAVSNAEVLGAIPDGNRVAVDFSRSAATFYWVEGDGFEKRLRGYVYRDCIHLDTETDESPHRARPGSIGRSPTVAQKNKVLTDEAKRGIRRIQLVFSDEDAYDKYRRLLGKRVAATGTLYGSYTGHHKTPVLLRVDTLEAK